MLDLRYPIGVYFLINSVILVATGLLKPFQSKVGSFSFELNLLWGIVMGVFGAFMLGLSLMDKSRKAAASSSVVQSNNDSASASETSSD